MTATLRHVGILVKNMKKSIEIYRTMGLKPMGPVEHLKVQKMVDKYGGMIELVEGNWRPHIAVNWYEDIDGNLIEFVREIKEA